MLTLFFWFPLGLNRRGIGWLFRDLRHCQTVWESCGFQYTFQWILIWLRRVSQMGVVSVDNSALNIKWKQKFLLKCNGNVYVFYGITYKTIFLGCWKSGIALKKAFVRRLTMNVPASKTIKSNKIIQAKLRSGSSTSSEVLHILSETLGVHIHRHQTITQSHNE